GLRPAGGDRDARIGLVVSAAVSLISQTRIRLSAPPATSRLPSGLNATAYCSLSGCESVSRRSPVATSQSLIVRSALALARILPSGLNARPNTAPLWPERVLTSPPVSTFQSLIFGS